MIYQSSSGNNQITSQNPLLTTRHFTSLMQKTSLPMAMQQRQAHFGRKRDGFRLAILPGGIGVEDGFAAVAGREVDKEGPRGTGRNGMGGLGGSEREGR